MWTRAELKTQAKAGLKGYYWWGFLAMIISGVVATLLNFGLSWIVPVIGSILVSTFLTNLLEVGQCSFFTKATRNQESPGIGDLFQCFKGGRYMTAVSVMFFRGLFIGLWSLLLIVPGIVKAYEYRMVSYLAAEYPEKGRAEIFALSKKMMTGNKFEAFLLDLSFIGWYLLGVLALGIGTMFVNPYKAATDAELYLRLKEDCLGIPRNGVGASVASDPSGIPAAPVQQIGTAPVNVRPAGRQPVAQDAPTMASGTAAKQGYLTGIQGEFTGASVPVEYGSTLVIGRDPSKCNLVIGGEQVSRVHLKIEFDGTMFRVTDLSSLGTFDLQAGRLPKGQLVLKQSGTYLQIGSGGDIFMLECK